MSAPNMPSNRIAPPPTSRDISVPPQVTGSDRVEHTVSPRIEQLRADAVDPAALPAAVRAFWEEVNTTGAPLVEPSPDEPARRTVTFLHRSDSDVDALLVANKIADASAFDDCRLSRVAGTDVWALSLLADSDWRASYAIAGIPADGVRPVSPMTEMIELRRSRSLAVSPPDSAPALERWFDALHFARPDPLAREQFDDQWSVVSLPDAPPARWAHAADHTPSGDTVEWTITSEALGNMRTIRAHVPRDLDRSAAPVLVLLDGEDWWHAGIVPMLDAMAGDGAAPPLLTVTVPALDFGTRVAELTCNPAFLAMLVDDVLGALPARCEVSLAPDRVVIAGQSLGGLTALYAACAEPEVFPHAVCQSGSFWWPNSSDGDVREWLTSAVRDGNGPAQRVVLEVGTHEWVLLEPTRRMRDALSASGADVVYREFNGGHDRACWRAGLPAAIGDITSTWT